MATKGKQEVEIKFVVRDHQALTRNLRAAGFRQKTRRTPEINILFDTPERAVSSRGEVLRIRQYGKVWTLTHKSSGAAGRHKVRTETELTISDGDALESIFQTLGLHPSFRYEKFRSEWTDGKGEVVVDETPIGNYGEIEGPPNWIDRTAKRLGIAPSEYITASYAKLFYAWKQRTKSTAREMTWQALGKRTK